MNATKIGWFTLGGALVLVSLEGVKKLWRKYVVQQGLAFEAEAASLSKAQVLELRSKLFSSCQSVSYSNSSPLMIVKGEGQYLVDNNGERWLDSRNNVGHVGWQDKDVVDAVTRQLSLTNSNTRYLHPFHVLLARRLLQTFQPGSSLREDGVCFFVNSGSEANELALRLARAKTNSRDTIVIERAYHGHTTSTVDISPYKFDGKGGSGKPSWVHVVPCPDTYHAANLTNPAEHFADYVREACNAINAKGGRLSAFFMESGMSVAGVILPPSNYLKLVYDVVRGNGGVCVADEVQTGLGRFGNYFWAFEQQNVTPDIVTIGKPFGNGFPLAAVVCTRSVAEAFENGMEYFSTFGGNPAACAAGLAVLEVIKRDKLQEHATYVGRRLTQKLVALQANAPGGRLIGDVRGCGLFQGIEFVKDPETKEPATKETSFIVTGLLREYKILTSVDGPHNNVLVIKPPLRFSKANVDYFVEALRAILSDMPNVNLASVAHTPT